MVVNKLNMGITLENCFNFQPNAFMGKYSNGL